MRGLGGQLNWLLQGAAAAVLILGVAMCGFSVSYLEWGSLGLSLVETLVLLMTPLAGIVVVRSLRAPDRRAKASVAVGAIMSLIYVGIGRDSWEMQHVRARCLAGSVRYCCQVLVLDAKHGRPTAVTELSPSARQTCANWAALGQSSRAHR